MKMLKGIFVCCLSVLLLCGCEKTNEEMVMTDAKKFKEEYESLNGTVRESDKEQYNTVMVDIDNPIVYVDCGEALEVLQEEKAILYIGANWCPWCRNAVPVLFEAAEEYAVDKIYYLNLDDEKSNYEVQDGKLVLINEGSQNYYKLLDALKEHLKDYVLTVDTKKYDTKEKRIYMPFVIGIKNGQVVSKHNGTVSLEEGQTKYSAMTEKQHDELYKAYQNMFKGIYGSSEFCGEEECS